jgi:SDR family mycofactocin-dependent oxidoreductase
MTFDDISSSAWEGKVALITGAARGQGRSHAIALAARGVHVVAFDSCATPSTIPYDQASRADLDETVSLIEDTGGKCRAVVGDVREFSQVQDVVDETLAEHGQIDYLVANAGVISLCPIAELSQEGWHHVVDTNLTGVFNTLRAVLPSMIVRRSGAIVATSSMAGRTTYQNVGHYAASKWGVLGLVKSAALENGQFGIRVNAVCPTNVDTAMLRGDYAVRAFRPDLDNPTFEDLVEVARAAHPLGVAYVEAQDITDTVMFLLSDRARYITGEAVTVSAGLIATNTA